jgi:multiple sugar transport system ATP-binding protein
VEFGDGVTLPAPLGANAKDGQPVLYGLRPEHCALGSDGLPVDVVVVEPTGADTQLYCRFNGQEVTATIDDRTNCRAGDRIKLAPDLRRAHLFDAASGARLAA